jgi:membrane protease YdiL (CAAX protease family)
MAAFPPTRRRALWRWPARLSAALVAWNNIVHLAAVTEGPLYVPLNVAAAAVVVTAARRRGLGPEAIGLDVRRWRGALAHAAAPSVAVAAGLLAAVATARLRPLLADARIGRLGPAAVGYQALVRIPLGTVLLEETAFRGVLPAAWEQAGLPPAPATLVSCGLFGLWHVRPTLAALDANGLGAAPTCRLEVVALAVIVTAVAGAYLAHLRRRSGTVLVPAVVHATSNSLATLAAFAVVRSTGVRGSE